MSGKFAPLFALMVLTLVSTSGCLSLPVTGSGQPSGSRDPVVQVETAVAPASTATLAAADSPLPAPTTAAADSPLPAPTTAAQDSPLPTPVANASSDATEPAVAAPDGTATPALGAALQTYRGPNPYRATPAFEISYDPARWEYVQDDGSGRPSQLKHRTIQGCAVWLRAGPVDAKQMAQVWLADRAWNLDQVQPKVIQYVSPQDDFAWIIGVLLPVEWSGRGNSDCQDAAELVIGTFKVVTE